MSRIHEALKKAEQERATGASPDTASAPAVPPDPTWEAQRAATEILDPSHVATRSLGISSPIEVGEPAAPLTLDTLRARCLRPRWNPKPGNLLFVHPHSHIHGTEEFRTLRSRLYRIRDQQPLRTVLIASVLPGEGKTFTAANLSQAIVRQHERSALIIDADLRRPSLHVYFGAPGTPGLTDYLHGEADEFSIIQRGPTDNLFFIPGGKLMSNPAELLANGRMKILVDRLAPVFDWILVDSPPVMAISDAHVLADLCDGVLLVIQAAKTPFDAAQKAREEFGDKRLLGVVLNRVEPGEGYRTHYYSYYQTSTKGKG